MTTKHQGKVRLVDAGASYQFVTETGLDVVLPLDSLTVVTTADLALLVHNVRVGADGEHDEDSGSWKVQTRGYSDLPLNTMMWEGRVDHGGEDGA
jgi:hypothetical protein